MKSLFKRGLAILLAAVLLSGGILSASALSGEGTATAPYLVTTAADFNNIRNNLGAYYKLTNNIDLSGFDSFAPIGNELTGPFTGTLDGAGYTVSSLTIVAADEKYVGIIGYNEGTVKDLNVTNADVLGGRNTGIIVGCNAVDASVTGCTVSGKAEGNTVAMEAYAGGIAGFNNGEVSDCNNYADISISQPTNDSFDPYEYSGGIIGYSDTEITVENCSNSGDIEGHYSAGIVGYANGIIMKNCSSVGNITANNANSSRYGYSGGMVGYAKDADIDGCINASDILRDTDGYGYHGGIIGYVDNNGKLTDVANYGLISTRSGYSSYVGGIVGYAMKNLTVIDGTNNGNISSTAYYSNSYVYVAGIAGYANNAEIGGCVNNGNIFSNNYTGGIVSQISGGMMYSCINNGDISGATSHYGIGYISGSGTIKECINTGEVGGNDFYSLYGIGRIDGTNSFMTDNIAVGQNEIGSTYGMFNNNVFISNTDCIKVNTSSSAIRKNNYYWNQGGIGLDGNEAKPLSLEEIKGITSDLNTTAEEIWVSDSKYNSGLPTPKSAPARLVLNEMAIVLTAGKTAQLQAFFDGSATSAVTFESLDSAIATVSSSGVITARANGTTRIAVRTYSGERANCWVYVITPAGSLSLPEEYTVERNNYVDIPVTFDCDANERVVFTSSDSNVATIENNGSIYARNAGTTVITANTPMSGKSDTCLLTVQNPVITNVSINSSYTVNIGTPYKIYPSVSPSPYRGTLYWQIEDESVATVDEDGVVTGLKVGKTSLTLTSDTGYSDVAIIEVKQPAQTIALNYTSAELDIGFTLQLKAIITPETCTDRVYWSNNNSNASVDSNGLVTAYSAGTVRVTARTDSGLEAHCIITVKSPVIEPESIALNTESVRLAKGKKHQLTATVNPSNATDKTVIWKSSDENVVTVSESGTIEGIAQGVAVITATTSNGITASCKVTVIDYGAVNSVFCVDSAIAKTGETVKLAVSVKDNSGLASFKHTVSFDSSKFTFVSAKLAEGVSGDFAADTSMLSYGKVNLSYLNLENYTANGALYELVFTVNDGTPANDYPITLTFDDSDICNIEGDSLVYLTENGKITVYEYAVGDINLDGIIGTKDAVLLSKHLISSAQLNEIQLKNADINGDGQISIMDRVALSKLINSQDYRKIATGNTESAPVISVVSTEGTIGKTAEVKLALSEEITLSGMLLSLEFNTDVLELKSAEIDSGNGTCTVKTNGDFANILWLAGKNTALSGEFMTLTFEIAENAIINSYPIKLIRVADNITDYSLGTVAVDTADGALLAMEEIEVAGDVNGDGFCDSQDLVLIKQGLLGVQIADGFEFDINGDGFKDVRDLIALKKLVASI